MRSEGTFTVASFTPVDVAPAIAIETAVAVGVATMEKLFTGGVSGRSATVFSSAFDAASGTGTYVAVESFDGLLDDRSGTFNFVHSATTQGSSREFEHFVIVPTSGTGELAGISGSGGMAVDDDGTHRIWFDYELR
ncbi:MAG: DUF3224 domain-containing protein [Aquihabitans sp.]